MAASDAELEDLTNDLIAVVWPFLDRHSGASDDVVDALNNALDAWSPPG